jgi:hypothetical protein
VWQWSAVYFHLSTSTTTTCVHISKKDLDDGQLQPSRVVMRKEEGRRPVMSARALAHHVSDCR